MVVFTIIGIAIEFYTLLVKAFQRELYFGKQKRNHTLWHVPSNNRKATKFIKEFLVRSFTFISPKMYSYSIDTLSFPRSWNT